MSTFAVTRERIGAVRPIPGADRIEIATLAGMDFQLVVARGAYQPGDEVLYLPVDAVLPPALVETLGLQGKLAGRERNRIKTVVLRGAYSQGVVTRGDLVPADVTDLAAHLGVTKWDPPPNLVPDGILVPRPEGQSRYDIESADRYTALVESLLDRDVFVTEKLEGENAWVTAWPDGSVAIGMRDNTILEKEGVENRFHQVLRAQGVPGFARELAERYGQRVAVYGEFVGPGAGPGNYYDLKRPAVRLFDIRVMFDYLPPAEFLERVEARWGSEPPTVPVLQDPRAACTLRTWLAGRTVKEASDGPSMLAPTKRREGIVIKPTTELRDDRIGRLILKQRSPAYLAHSDL